MSRMPELASESAFDCAFSKHSQEDAVLWRGIKAWRQTDLPMPHALATLKDTAKDPRTRAAFGDPEQQAQTAEGEPMGADSPELPLGAR
jgi:hypothetical protein